MWGRYSDKPYLAGIPILIDIFFELLWVKIIKKADAANQFEQYIAVRQFLIVLFCALDIIEWQSCIALTVDV